MRARNITSATWRGNLKTALDYLTINGATRDDRIVGKAAKMADTITRREIPAEYERWMRTDGGRNRVAWGLSAIDNDEGAA